MSEPLTSAVGTAVIGSLATSAAKKLAGRLQDTKVARKARDKLRPGQLQPKAKRIFGLAISDAADFPQMSSELVEAFIRDRENRKILSGWIWDSENAAATKDQLNRHCAVGRSERQNLERFIERLPAALEQACEEVLDPATWVIVEKLSAATRREGRETRGHITSEHRETRDYFSSKIEEMKGELETLQIQEAAGEDSAEQVESSVRSDLDEAERLLGKSRIADARFLAQRALGKVQSEDLSDEALRIAHRHLANCFLNTAGEEEKAAEHLDELVELSSDDDTRLRNQALACLQRGELEAGLELIDQAIGDEGDRKAVLIKAQLLAALDREEEAADLFSKVADPEDPDDLRSLGIFEARAGRHQEALKRAREVLRLNPEHAGAQLLFGLAVTGKHKDEIDRGNPGIEKEEAKLLREAEKHLSSAAETFAGVGRTYHEGLAYLQRGGIRVWLDDHTGATGDLERALKRGAELEQALYNLALLSIGTDDPERGLQYIRDLRSVADQTNPDDVLALESRLLAASGRTEDAVDLLEKALEKEQPASDHVRVKVLLAQALNKDFQTERASALLSELKSAHPTDPRVTLAQGKQALRQGNRDQAVAFARETLELGTGLLKAKAEAFLAQLVYDRGAEENSDSDLEEALEIYAGYADPSVRDFALRQQALCLFRLGRDAECLQLCEEAQEKEWLPLFAELEALIYANHKNFSQAAERYKWLAGRTRGGVDFLLKYGNCLYLLGREREAVDALDQAARRIGEEDPQGHAVVSRAYASVGKMQKALRHAHVALQHGEEEPQYHQHYITLFITYGNEIEAQDAATEEQTKTFQRVIAEYNDLFPEEQFFQTVEMPLGDDEALIERMREQLPSTETIQEKERLMKEEDFPVGSMAKAIGKTIPETWRALAGPGFGIASDEGVPGLVENEARTAAQSSAVVVDLVPLLTIGEVGLLSELSDFFENVYIPQAAFDELRRTIEQEHPQAGESRLSVVPEGEEIRVIETSASTGDAWVERLDVIRDFLTADATSNVALIGESVGRRDLERTLEDERLEGARLGEIVGQPSSEAFWEAQMYAAPLYAENRMLRGLARAEEVDAFGTRAILAAMLTEDFISERTYHEATIRLVQLNYYFRIITADTILYGIKRDGFLNTSFSRAALEALADSGNNPFLKLLVGMKVLVRLWKGYAPENEPLLIAGKPTLMAQWTWHLLDVFAESSEEMPFLLRQSFMSVLPDWPLEKTARGFDKVFRAWNRDRSE